MDAEKRHQLKTNELAEALANLRSFGTDPRTRLWLIAMAVVIVAVVGYRVWASVRESQLASGWQELSDATTKLSTDNAAGIADLRSVVANASNPALAASARIRLARALQKDAETAGEGKGEALYKESIEALTPVAENSALPPEFVAAALFSLATSHESLRQFDQAKAEYERILNDARFSASPFQAVIKERLTTLEELRARVELQPGMPPAPSPTTRPELKPGQGPPGMPPGGPKATIRPAGPSGQPAPGPPAPGQPAPGHPAAPAPKPAPTSQP